MSTDVKLDMTEFNKALQEYQEVSGKDYAHAANRTLNNLCIKAVKISKRADTALIKAIPQTLEWWPKLVAKVLVKRKIGQIAAKGKAVKIRWKAGKSRLKGRYYSLAQARAKSNALIRARVNASTFIAGFFVTASREIVNRIGGRSERGKSFAGLMSSFTPATAGLHLTTAIVSAFYNYKKRKGTTGQTADGILQATLNLAVPATIEDMRGYIQDQLQKRAKQFSAK